MIFTKFKLIAGGLVIVAVLGLGYTGYRKYTNLVNDNMQLNQNVATLKRADGVNQATIAKMKSDAITNQANLDSLSYQLDKAENESKELQRILQRHDLKWLAYNKPGLLTNRFNKATDALWGDFQAIGE